MAKKKTSKSRRSETVITRKKKKGILPSFEVLIILVFLGSFIIWAISRCNATKQLYEMRDRLANGPDSTDVAPAASPSEVPLNSTTPSTTATTTPVAAPSKSTLPTPYTSLYITIDSLNVRKGPSLDSVIVSKCLFNEKVSYLNEVTNFKQNIFIEGVNRNEPWVKIRTHDGNVGWIFGAGVDFYQRKERIQY